MTRALSVLLVVLGVGVIARTLAEGIGGGVGLVLGALLVAVGAGRLLLGRSS